MKRQKKQNPLVVVYFMAAFGFTYLLMPYALEIVNINASLEIIDRLKSGQIFLEFLIFIVIFLAVAFLMEFIMKLFRVRKSK